ncbi:MAG: MBL fold metallo-hydrolase [Proteobacteria bacterium]|nr:MBL fold metallo-hydrolase [Pseudomonadota bacterium]
MAAPSSKTSRRYWRGPPTDHFDGERFFNPGGHGPRGIKDLLRWHLGGGKVPWPSALPSPFPPDRPPLRVDGGAIRVSFVGHATFLIQGGGLNIVTDPVWSDRASPLTFLGPKRRNPPGIAFDDLPRIDAVLLSHCHYDHMDLTTLRRLWDRDRPLIVTPLGNDTIIRGRHAAIDVLAADWGDTIPLGGAARTSLLPAHHWSARRFGDRNHALWCAFVIEGLGQSIYFGGDTGFADGRPFRHVVERHGSPDLALLPIGAYEPRWFMSPQHMNPDDAVMAFELLRPKHALGYHWGTFRLTDEGAEQPRDDLATALAARGIAAERFLALHPGQTWTYAAAG